MGDEATHRWAETHTPQNCPGLAEVRAHIGAIHKLLDEHQDWMENRFDETKDLMDRELKALEKTVEDVRRLAVGSAADLKGGAAAAGQHSTDNFREVFTRLVRIEKQAAVQWVFIVLLSLMGLGRGIAWVYEVLKPLFGA
jgi:hypothetical protein